MCIRDRGPDVAHEVASQYSRACQNAAHEGADDTVRRDVLTGQIQSINRSGGPQPGLAKALWRDLVSHEAAALTVDKGIGAQRGRNHNKRKS